MYETTEEARQKLENSTVLFDNEPVHVTGIGGSKSKVKVQYVKLPYFDDGSNKTDLADINDIRWDFKSLGTRLGYVNIASSPWTKTSEALFVTRTPTRHSRQGLDRQTVRVMQFPQILHPWEWTHLLKEEGLVKSIRNDYPTAPEAVKTLLNNANTVLSVAIDRRFMVTFDKVNPPNLVYRNDKIGYTENGITFKLAQHKAFLKEELTDCMYFKISP